MGTVVDLPAMTPTAWVVFASIPPTLSGQTVSSFKMSPSTMQVADESDTSRKLMMALLSAGVGDEVHRLRVGATYRMQLYKRTLVESAPTPAPGNAPKLSASELKQALGATETLDFATPAFQEQLTASGLRPREGEGELTFAKRAFVALRGSLQYDYRTGMDRHSSVVLKTGKSDCGGINGLFVSVMRANGIPARALCGAGRRVPIRKRHCAVCPTANGM